jgi:hypothetical protein
MMAGGFDVVMGGDPSPEDLSWCRQQLDIVRDGGIWGVPRSGLLFTRRGDGFVLTARMPWIEEMEQAYLEGRDVPSSADALRAYQDADYELIRSRFAAAGIEVTDGTGG